MRRFLVKTATTVALSLFPLAALAAPVLTNGDFEQNPPSVLGNNLDYSIAPWTIGGGARSNVVRVDGPGGTLYRSSSGNWIGPEADASGVGGGVMQHYLDITNGQNSIDQEFTPLCTGETLYGAYFSGRVADTDGVARVSILDASGAVVAGPATVTVNPSDVQTQAWKYAAFSATLTANTLYKMQVFMDNHMNMDNAFVSFTTDCPEHDNPPFDLPDSATVQTTKTCTPLVAAEDGFLESTCTITAGFEASGAPTQVRFNDILTVDGSVRPTAVTTLTSSDPWDCGTFPSSFNAQPIECAWENPPSGATSSVLTADIRLSPEDAARGAELKNCAEVIVEYEDGAFGPGDETEETCAVLPISQPPVPTQPASIEKICEAPIEAASAAAPLYDVACQITVTPAAPPSPNSYLFFEEQLTAPDGTVNSGAIATLTAAGWTCQPDAAPFTGTQVPQCYILHTDLPPEGQVIDVGLSLTPDNDADWQNCARLTQVIASASQIQSPEEMHAAFLDGNAFPETQAQGEACVDIPVPHTEDTPPPPAGAQCTPFTPDVACDAATGTWTVSLQNSLSGSFDPSDIEVSTDAQGISLIPGHDPLNFRVSGAQPGDSFTVNTQAVQNGAGGGRGLDLCCMGEITVTIPQGQTCEPPESDRDLTVNKTCAPIAEGAEGENYECVFTVDYSGPAPSASNPITVTDSLVSGGPMQIWSFDPPIGDASEWSCADAGMPTAGPLACEMHAGLLPGKPAGYWQNFSQSFALRIAVTEPFVNCADASVKDQTGAPIEAQSCYTKGDFDLEITKRLADKHGGECRTGAACTFVYDVTNVGGDPYTGPISLADVVTTSGQAPLGSFTAITPAICDPADLSGGLCSDAVSLNPGESTSYEVDYLMPVGAGDLDATNCVTLTDSSVGADEDAAQIDGHQACVDFFVRDEDEDETGEIDLTIAKTFLDGNADQASFELAPSLTTGTLSAGDVVTVSDDLGAAGFIAAAVDPGAAADGWVCQTTGAAISCSFTATTATTTLPPLTVGGQIGAAFWTENCADVSASVTEADMGNNQSCVQSELPGNDEEEGDGPDSDIPQTATLSLEKLCQPAVASDFQGVPGWEWTCDITLSVSDGQILDPVVMLDTYDTGSAPFGGIVSITPGDPMWTCTIGAGAASGNCAASSGLTGPASYSFVSTVFAADVAQSGVMDARNCASLPEQGGESCAALNAEITEQPEELSYDLVKTCGPAREGEHLGVPGWFWDCDLTVSASGDAQSGAMGSGEVLISDSFTPGDAPFGAITTLTPASGTWACALSDGGLQGSCTGQGAEIAAGSQHVITAQVFAADMQGGGVLDGENCASVTAPGTAEASTPSCAVLEASPEQNKDEDIPTPASGPVLELVKSSDGPCAVNTSARTYSCGFSLSLRNVGDAVYDGPVVIDDSFGAPKPSRVTGSGAGWNCFRSDGKGTSCVAGRLTLQPGAQSVVQMDLTLPGLARGGQFENCAAIGVGGSKFLRASIVQQAMQLMGIDGGPVDGARGRKTREGVRALQERLGLTPTGQIDDDLFAALGVPAAGAANASCVTVDLPPMPVSCEPGQERNSKGVCYWPQPDCQPGQKINSKGQCYTPRVDPDCPSGQQLNSKGQCYTPRTDPDCARGQKLNSKGQCYTPREECRPGQKRNSRGVCYTPQQELSCNSASTVKRNGACVCRYKGMRQISDTRCACTNGLPVVPGAGCIRIEKKRGNDGAAGDDRPRPKKDNQVCVTVLGNRICN